MGENEDLLSESSTTTPDTSGLESRNSTKSKDYASVLRGVKGLDQTQDLIETDFKSDATRPLHRGYIEFLGAVYVGGAPINHHTYLLMQMMEKSPGGFQLQSQKTINEHISSVRNHVNSSAWLQFYGSMES